MSLFDKLFGKGTSPSKQGENLTSGTKTPASFSFEPAEIGTLLCVPGPWENRSEFVQSVAGSSKGNFIFAGLILMETGAERHVHLDFYDRDPTMVSTFEHTCRGKISDETLKKIANHKSAVYLHFDPGILEQLEKIATFSTFIQSIGGIAVKIESVGISHEWERWNEILKEGDVFELYSNFVVLTGDEQRFYSYGMKHFKLPDCKTDKSLPIAEAGKLMNHFNFYQINEQPNIRSGHTFSAEANAPMYKAVLLPDDRDDSSGPLYNENGIWKLVQVR